MTLHLLDKAEDDLVDGFRFYERQQPGLGSYFLTSLQSDIEALRFFAGIHRVVYGKYMRSLSRRFPFAIFYTVEQGEVFVHAVLDCRRRPSWVRRQLRS